MSVIMTMMVDGDPEAFEKYASANRETMETILEAAKGHGLIAHRFYRSADGARLMVADEWPDRQSFETFFQEQASKIGPMMQAAGVTAEPTPLFWEEIDAGDAFGWGA